MIPQQQNLVNGETPVSLTVSLTDVNLIIVSLAERPYKDVIGLIQQLQAQTQASINAAFASPPSELASSGAEAGAVG